MNNTVKRPPREAVLIALHGDGYVEAFAAKNVDIKIVSVPHCPGNEILAEDTVERTLRHRYRDLYWPVNVRASAMHRPLLPSTMARAVVVRDCLSSINTLAEKHQPEQEVTTWTL